MDAYNPFEDPTEETDVLTGQRLMPNTPRDPMDPREKLRSYLASKMEADKKMMSPDYRQAMRAPQNELMENNRGLALQGLLQNSAAMLGTIGGKTASTAGSDNYLKQLQGFNADTMRGIEGERSQMQGQEDQRLKMMQYLADRQGTAEEKAAMRGEREEDRKIKRMTAEALLEQKRKQGEASSPMGKAQAAQDADWVKRYNEWTTTDRGTFDKNIEALDDAISKLETSGSSGTLGLTGTAHRFIPDKLRPDDSIAVQEQAQAALQGALKATLGAQFTALEGQQVLSRGYNPGLSPAENVKKLKAERERLLNNAKIMNDMSRYYEQQGTVKGFQDPRSFNPGVDDDEDSAALQWARQNPNDPRAAEIIRVQGGGK
jgi:hypothetical protein